MYCLGIDLGSSSVKVTLLDALSGKRFASTQYPDSELLISAPQSGFAEQDPDTWWDATEKAIERLKQNFVFDPKDINAIGISYQMHGLVCVDSSQRVVRPSIIWCDSRAVEIGADAFDSLGKEYCATHLLNSPGNFTASKLKWVQTHQPDIYQQIDKIMLPGDYIAMRLTGEVNTTALGLSEAILWDHQNNQLSKELMDHYGFKDTLIPTIVPTFGDQGTVLKDVAQRLGLHNKVKVTYRAGDQPNNALSLNVMEPGEVATTAGTSGVIYAVTDKKIGDEKSRVNTFLHPKDSSPEGISKESEHTRNGILLCVNGTGRMNSWLKGIVGTDNNMSYEHMNALAQDVEIGAEGLAVHPFGNGAERMFENQVRGGDFQHIDFNRHHLGHIIRATQEGIVFALNYGFDMLKAMGVDSKCIKAPYGNMFLSPIFTEAFVNTCECKLELYDTDGAEGAARAAAYGLGFYKSQIEMFTGIEHLRTYLPENDKVEQYKQSYDHWKQSID